MAVAMCGLKPNGREMPRAHRVQTLDILMEIVPEFRSKHVLPQLLVDGTAADNLLALTPTEMIWRKDNYILLKKIS